MDITKLKQGSSVEVKMNGKFTFADRQIFKEITAEMAEGGISQVILNFSNVDFVDSAALGVLLLAKDEAEKNNVSLILRQPVEQVKKMFEISCFYDLFTIEG